MSPEEKIIYNLLVEDNRYSTNQTSIIDLLNKTNNDFTSPIVNTKNKLTALIQHELSKIYPFILPIQKITSSTDDLYTCYEGFNNENFKSNIIKVENPGSSVDSSIANFPFPQYIVLLKTLQDTHNISLNWDDFVIYIIDKKYYPINVSYDLSNSSSIKINDTVESTQLFISFIKTPEFMYKYIVYPSLKNTQTLYMYGLYLSKSSNIDYILDGVFQDVLRKSTSFEQVINNLILSEYPTFETFYKSFKIKGEMIPQTIHSQLLTVPTLNIKSKVLKLYLSQSEELINIENKGIDLKSFSEYDYTMLDMYIEILKDERDLEVYFKSLTNNYYMFPVLKNVYKYISFDDEKFNKFLSNSRLSYNFKLFLKTLNVCNISHNIDNSLLEQVDRFYYINKILFNFFRPFYYNYISLKLCSEENIKYKYLSYIPSQIDSIKRYINYMNSTVPSVLKTLNKELVIPSINISKIIGNTFDETVFYPTYSLMQMKFVDHFSSQSLVDLLFKLIFFGKNVKHNKPLLLATVRGMSENDIDIYKQLLYLYKKSYVPSEEEFDRGEFRVKELNSFNFFSTLKVSDPLNFKYLDFGGGKGDITNSITKYLKLSKENVFVTDIKDWFGNEIVEKYKNNITYRYLKSNILPFEDNTFDFISAFQVLHHVPDVNKSLQELWRISKNGAIILIREHDCNSNVVRALIDIEHAVFELVKDPVENVKYGEKIEDPDYTYLQNYNDSLKYMSKNELFNKLNFGFEYIDLSYPPEKGPTRYYYSVWRVVKEEPTQEIIYTEPIKEETPELIISEPLATKIEFPLLESELTNVDDSLLEKELVRKESYLNIIQTLSNKKIMKDEDLKYMVLRYFFNKMIKAPTSQDPVFIEGNNEYAKIQINNDINWFKSQRKFIDNRINIIDIIENGIKEGLNKLKKLTKVDDNLITTGSVIKYKFTIIDDIRGIISNEKDPNKQKYLAAASIRYKYMAIGTCGLSIDYFKLGYNPSDNVTEGFGGIFNHYFNNYCSAFEDLEKPLGSLGNFFTIDKFPTNIVHLNPPYDETLMGLMINKVKQMVDENSELTFILTLPNWPNFKEKENIRPKYYSKSFKEKLYKREEFTFIDFNGREVKPVDIIQIFVGNQNINIPEN
jgi:ubiquinone/menaquinone biosynthesis C-methylase UbiE